MSLEVVAMKEFSPGLLEEALALDSDAFGEICQTIYSMEAFARFGRIFLLYEDGTLVGASEFIKDWSDPKTVYGVGIAIKKDKQNTGFGAVFLKGIIARFKEEGIEQLFVHVDPSNERALHFNVDKLGFRKVEYRSDEYGQGKDRWLLELALQ